MSTRRLAGALALLVACSLSPLAALPFPKGEIVRVDAAGDDCQEQVPDVAPLRAGGYVAVWAGGFDPDDPSATRIYARVTGADGAPAGPEIRVSERGRLLKTPAVAVGTDGRFLVTWTDAQDGRVAGRLFTAAGVPVAGEKLLAEEHFVTASDVAARPAGGYAVLFVGDATAFVALIDADGDTGRVGIVGFFNSPIGFDPTIAEPEIAVQPDGDLVVVWILQDLLFLDFSGPVVTLLAADDVGSHPDRWTSLDVDPDYEFWKTGVSVGTDNQGNIVVAWVEHQGDRPGTPATRLKAQIFDPQGHKTGPAFQVDGGTWSRVGTPRVLAGMGGDFVLAWHGVAAPASSTAPSSIYARSFSAQGVAAGDPVVLAPAAGHSREEPALAWLVNPGGGGNGGGVAGGAPTAVAVWQEGRAGAPTAPQGCFSAGIGARRFVPGCVPTAGRLCLGDGRFQLSSVWTTPGATGQGQAQTVTRDTGYFWFFDPSNVELMVKVLDGRAVNGKFWVFYGALSNVAWTLRVEDLLTGAEKTYSNPPGQLASRGDTAALPGESTAASGSFEILPFEAPPAAAPAPLSPVPPGLLLNDGRFIVDVFWRDPFNHTSGFGSGTRLTDDSGYFVFFSRDNVELVVKVLDGRAVNGKFWVFYGALTNVEYDITVTDSATGASRSYHNPPFQFRSVADTGAFD